MDESCTLDEVALQKAIVSILGGESTLPKNLLQSEKILYKLLENLSSSNTPKEVLKLNFCLVTLILQYWKASSKSKDLPQLAYNYFEVVDCYICFSKDRDLCLRKTYKEYKKALDQNAAKSPAPIYSFIPMTETKGEKRLYRVLEADVDRIAKAGNWEKLPNPQHCTCWIRLPSNFTELHRNSPSNKKFSRDLIECSNLDPCSSSRQQLLERSSSPTQPSRKRGLSIKENETSESKSSLFKTSSSKSSAKDPQSPLEQPGKSLKTSSFKNQERTPASCNARPMASDRSATGIHLSFGKHVFEFNNKSLQKLSPDDEAFFSPNVRTSPDDLMDRESTGKVAVGSFNASSGGRHHRCLTVSYQ